MNAILYIGHGTRSKQGAEQAREFLRTIIRQTGEPIQEISFLELAEPLIDLGFTRCIEQGATHIRVVPLFLLTAGHMKHDIPEALAPLQAKHPAVTVEITPAFGVQSRILDAVQTLVRSRVPDVGPKDSILLVGRGSSDPETRIAFRDIASGIQQRLNVATVETCYLAAIEPRLDEGLSTITQHATRTIVVPYLLFGGLLLSEVQQKVRRKQRDGHSIIYTDALSHHEAIRQIVIERATGKEHHHATTHH